MVEKLLEKSPAIPANLLKYIIWSKGRSGSIFKIESYLLCMEQWNKSQKYRYKAKTRKQRLNEKGRRDHIFSQIYIWTI
jgi:hypothetical protein